MKRFLTILLAIVLLLSAGLFVRESASAEEFATITSTNGYGVRLRSGPGTSYSVIGKYPVGTTATILQRGSAWSQIMAGGTTGWMNNSFLIFGTSGSSSSSASVSGVCSGTVYSPNGLRVWLRATAGGKRLALYSAGTPLTVLTKDTTWCRVYISGSVGYMMTEYITMGSAPQPAEKTKLTAVAVNYENPAVGDVLVASVTPANATATYVWTVDGEEYSTSSQLTVLDRFANKTIKVKATGTGNYTGSVVYTTAAVQQDPWIKGVELSNAYPIVGETLYAKVQPTSADVIYSWRVNGQEMSTEASYTVTSSDFGKLIQLKVTGRNNYSGSASVTAKSNVSGGTELASVTISNTSPKVGDILTASVSPAAANVAYTWTADGMEVSSSPSYQVKADDLGRVIKVVAKGVSPYTGELSTTTDRVKTAYLTGITLSTVNPCAENTVTATVQPAEATAVYQWYRNGTKISGETGASIVVKADWAGEKLSVSAVGTGVYGGKISSGNTNAIIVNPVIKSVALSIASPVVGDQITAFVSFTPDASEVERVKYQANNITYLWYIENELFEKSSATIQVPDSAFGKTIRVRVIGTGIVQGSAVSAFTGQVVSTKALSKNEAAIGSYYGTLANQRSPEVGETLYATVTPGAAADTVEHYWFRGQTLLAKGSTYTVQAADRGSKLMLITKPAAGSHYTGEVGFQTAMVDQKTPMNYAFNLAAPEKGKTPQYSTQATDGKGNVIAKATVSWWLDKDCTQPAKFDEFGTFMPSTVYVAQLKVSLADGWTLLLSNPMAGEKYPHPYVAADTLRYTFDATASDKLITDLYIDSVKKPVVGEKAVTSFSCTQYTASVNWTVGVKDGVFISADEYKAEITITPQNGYMVQHPSDPAVVLPENAFTVNGAAKTLYSSGSTKITAVYEVTRKLTIVPDATTVELDGSSDQQIICYAKLSGMAESLNESNTSSITWKLIGDITNNKTCINEYGVVYIAGAETVGKSLTVKCVAVVSGKEYTATQSLNLVSGSKSKTVSVVFETVHSSIVAGGSSLTFKAHAVNSDKGVIYYVESDSSTSKLSHTNINKETGVLTVGVDEQANMVVVYAQSKEAGKEAYAKWEVTIIHEPIETRKLKAVALENDGKQTYLFGKSLSTMTFPMAKLTYEDDTTETVNVDWDYTSVTPDYDPSNKDGSQFTIKGKVILPGDVVNPKEISLDKSAEITVSPKEKLYLVSASAPVWDVSALKNGVTVSQIISNLPKSVACVLNTKKDETGESSNGILEITWDETSISPAYNAESTEKSIFSVKGKMNLSPYENPKALTDEVSLEITVAAKGFETKVLSVDTTTTIKDIEYSSSVSDESIIAGLEAERDVTYKMGENTLTAKFPVAWTVVNSYDPSIPTSQTINLTGTVLLSGIDNTDEVDASIAAIVTVKAQPAKLEISNPVFTLPDCDIHHKAEYAQKATFTVRNVGGKDATINTVSTDSVLTCADSSINGTTLKPYESAVVTVDILPANITKIGSNEMNLTLNYETSEEVKASMTLNVTGTAIGFASLTASPNPAKPSMPHDITVSFTIDDIYGDFVANGGTVEVVGHGAAITPTDITGSYTFTDTFTDKDIEYTVVLTEGNGLKFTQTLTVNVESPTPLLGSMLLGSPKKKAKEVSEENSLENADDSSTEKASEESEDETSEESSEKESEEESTEMKPEEESSETKPEENTEEKSEEKVEESKESTEEKSVENAESSSQESNTNPENTEQNEE